MRQKRRPFNVNDTDDNGNAVLVVSYWKKNDLINLYGIGGKYTSKKNLSKKQGKVIKNFLITFTQYLYSYTYSREIY